jgi:ubiquinone/menaquinone biosynthesis C-methylase UbiE
LDHHEEIERIRQVYATQYRPDPKDRSYSWNVRNPVSVYYRHAFERAFVKLINDLDIDVEPLQFLDVGCGNGNFLRYLASLGATPEFMHGVDLMEYRIEQARLLSPATIDYCTGDAQQLPYPDFKFDLVSQLTVFSSVHEPGLREKMAREMDRVLKPGGFLLWYDLRIGYSTSARGIGMDEVISLFQKYTIQWKSRLHPQKASSLARGSIILAEIAEFLPGIKKTHILCLLKKPAG